MAVLLHISLGNTSHLQHKYLYGLLKMNKWIYNILFGFYKEEKKRQENYKAKGRGDIDNK